MSLIHTDLKLENILLVDSHYELFDEDNLNDSKDFSHLHSSSKSARDLGSSRMISDHEEKMDNGFRKRGRSNSAGRNHHSSRQSYDLDGSTHDKRSRKSVPPLMVPLNTKIKSRPFFFLYEH
jgi:hypothetical protein